MIVKLGERVFTIKRNGVTYKDFQRAQQIALLEAQLLDVKQLIVSESARGTSRELRRLREKAVRLEKRITEAQKALDK